MVAGLDPVPGDFLVVFLLGGQLERVVGVADDGFRDRVGRTGLRAFEVMHELVLVEVLEVPGRNLEVAVGKGARLVGNDGFDVEELVKIGRTFDDQPVLRGEADPGEVGKGDAQDDRAGAGNDEEGEADPDPGLPSLCVADSKEQGRNYHHEGREKDDERGVVLAEDGDEFLGLALAAAGVLDESHDLGQGRRGIRLGDLDGQIAALESRAREDFVAFLLIDRDELAGERTHVDVSFAGDDDAVGGERLADLDHHEVADLEIFRLHGLEAAGPDPSRRFALEANRIDNRIVRFPAGDDVKEVAELIERYDHDRVEETHRLVHRDDGKEESPERGYRHQEGFIEDVPEVDDVPDEAPSDVVAGQEPSDEIDGEEDGPKIVVAEPEAHHREGRDRADGKGHGQAIALESIKIEESENLCSKLSIARYDEHFSSCTPEDDGHKSCSYPETISGLEIYPKCAADKESADRIYIEGTGITEYANLEEASIDFDSKALTDKVLNNKDKYLQSLKTNLKKAFETQEKIIQESFQGYATKDFTLSNSSEEEWKKANIVEKKFVENFSYFSEDVAPQMINAAEKVRQYKTTGTNAGDWHLPAPGLFNSIKVYADQISAGYKALNKSMPKFETTGFTLKDTIEDDQIYVPNLPKPVTATPPNFNQDKNDITNLIDLDYSDGWAIRVEVDNESQQVKVVDTSIYYSKNGLYGTVSKGYTQTLTIYPVIYF